MFVWLASNAAMLTIVSGKVHTCRIILSRINKYYLWLMALLCMSVFGQSVFGQSETELI